MSWTDLWPFQNRRIIDEQQQQKVFFLSLTPFFFFFFFSCLISPTSVNFPNSRTRRANQGGSLCVTTGVSVLTVGGRERKSVNYWWVVGVPLPVPVHDL